LQETGQAFRYIFFEEKSKKDAASILNAKQKTTLLSVVFLLRLFS